MPLMNPTSFDLRRRSSSLSLRYFPMSSAFRTRFSFSMTSIFARVAAHASVWPP